MATRQKRGASQPQPAGFDHQTQSRRSSTTSPSTTMTSSKRSASQEFLHATKKQKHNDLELPMHPPSQLRHLTVLCFPNSRVLQQFPSCLFAIRQFLCFLGDFVPGSNAAVLYGTKFVAVSSTPNADLMDQKMDELLLTPLQQNATVMQSVSAIIQKLSGPSHVNIMYFSKDAEDES